MPTPASPANPLTLPPEDRLPKSLAALTSVIGRLTTAQEAEPEPPLAATAVGNTGMARRIPTRLTLGLTLPYPAAVYRAAAREVEQVKGKMDGDGQGFHDPLTLCVAEGPHVQGTGCRSITIATLLQGIADALDPPAPVSPETPPGGGA